MLGLSTSIFSSIRACRMVAGREKKRKRKRWITDGKRFQFSAFIISFGNSLNLWEGGGTNVLGLQYRQLRA